MESMQILKNYMMVALFVVEFGLPVQKTPNLVRLKFLDEVEEFLLNLIISN